MRSGKKVRRKEHRNNSRNAAESSVTPSHTSDSDFLSIIFALLLHLVSSKLSLQNETHRRVGLAAETRPLSSLLSFRCLPAKRLEFAGSKESCSHLMASDAHHHQSADRHTTFNHGHRRALVALDHHHALTCGFYPHAAACKRSIGIIVAPSMPGCNAAYVAARLPDRRARSCARPDAARCLQPAHDGFGCTHGSGV
jgi:hypothetical protein